MNEMQEKFKDFVQEELSKREEIEYLADILALDSMDSKTLPIVLLRFGSVVSAVDAGLAGGRNKELFDSLYSSGDFLGAYNAIKDVFLHYFVALTIKVKDYEGSLSRKLLVPFRASLSDVIYATLAAFRSKGIYEAFMRKDDLYFSPLAFVEGDDLCSDIYPATMLYTLKGATIYYDYNETYRFSISMRKPKLVKDDFEASVLVEGAKGYGIIDGDKKPIDDYFYKNIINHDFNWANPDLEGLMEEIEERYLTIRYNFENRANENDDASLNDTNTTIVS